MSLSAAEVWERLLARARQELPEQTFRTWLEPTEALALDGDTIVVGAPDQFAADWNESKHSALLASYGPVALGHPVSVVFRVHDERRTRPQMDFLVEPPPPERRAQSAGRGDTPAALRSALDAPRSALAAPRSGCGRAGGGSTRKSICSRFRRLSCTRNTTDTGWPSATGP